MLEGMWENRGKTQSWSGLQKTQRGVNVVFIGPSRRVLMLARGCETYLSPLPTGDGKGKYQPSASGVKQRATVLQRRELSVSLLSRM